MPESTRLEQLTVVMACCQRPMRLQVPFTLVTDDDGDVGQLVVDQLAAGRAIAVHLRTCPHAAD